MTENFLPVGTARSDGRKAGRELSSTLNLFRGACSEATDKAPGLSAKLNLWKRTLPTQTPLLTERQDNPSVVALGNGLLNDWYWWRGMPGCILAALAVSTFARLFHPGPYTSPWLRRFVALEAADTLRKPKMRPSLRYRRPLLRSRTPDRRISASHRRCSSTLAHSTAQHGALQAPAASSPYGPAAPGSHHPHVHSISTAPPGRNITMTASRHASPRCGPSAVLPRDRAFIPDTSIYPLHPTTTASRRTRLERFRLLAIAAAPAILFGDLYERAASMRAPPNARVVFQDCRPRFRRAAGTYSPARAPRTGAASEHQLHTAGSYSPVDRGSVALQGRIREPACGAAGDVLCATADPTGRVFVYGTDGWRWEAEGRGCCEWQGEVGEAASRAELKKVKEANLLKLSTRGFHPKLSCCVHPTVSESRSPRRLGPDVSLLTQAFPPSPQRMPRFCISGGYTPRVICAAYLVLAGTASPAAPDENASRVHSEINGARVQPREQCAEGEEEGEGEVKDKMTKERGEGAWRTVHQKPWPLNARWLIGGRGLSGGARIRPIGAFD
ncbi:hypothetical protein C8J57DRAFT_1571397 [Mycena rebaudengoi]|nr:hypothetical protein C8J57DRAFT_1571397 [Mycena rebaudengoi]